MKKYFLIVIIGLTTIACAGKKDKTSEIAGIDGKKLFKTNCVLCHGEDGKLGLNNSKDLSKSKLTMDERITMVTNGKNAMTGFGTLLSKDEIKAVSAYTFKLKE
jgi:cytochrome c6